MKPHLAELRNVVSGFGTGLAEDVGEFSPSSLRSRPGRQTGSSTDATTAGLPTARICPVRFEQSWGRKLTKHCPEEWPSDNFVSSDPNVQFVGGKQSSSRLVEFPEPGPNRESSNFHTRYKNSTVDERGRRGREPGERASDWFNGQSSAVVGRGKETLSLGLLCAQANRSVVANDSTDPSRRTNSPSAAWLSVRKYLPFGGTHAQSGTAVGFHSCPGPACPVAADRMRPARHAVGFTDHYWNVFLHLLAR